jgi:exonuclease III
MRIGTWNVEYATGPEKNRRRLDELRKHNADIWVLTETHDNLDLSATHKPINSAQRPGVRNISLSSRWVTIWTRYPVRDVLCVLDDKRSTACLLDTPNGPMIVYGTVLPWHSDQGDKPSKIRVPNWSEHYRVIAEQSLEWASLRHEFPGVPLCIAGDLNMNIGGPHWYGTRQGRDGLQGAMEKSGLVCVTEHERMRRFPLRHSLIDHILLPTNLAESACVAAAWEGTDHEGVRLSDHIGVVVEVKEQG